MQCAPTIHRIPMIPWDAASGYTTLRMYPDNTCEPYTPWERGQPARFAPQKSKKDQKTKKHHTTAGGAKIKKEKGARAAPGCRSATRPLPEIHYFFRRVRFHTPSVSNEGSYLPMPQKYLAHPAVYHVSRACKCRTGSPFFHRPSP